ncbi:MAG: hypothetical protein M3010_03145, partial [Candidatus Dormibacteraeota bacterium]|nr:hypothetical protein [Candidatus Dormibacteraeota bacterium]
TYNVNTTADLADGGPLSSTHCAPDPQPQVGSCSIRSAIQQANAAASGTITQINVPANANPYIITIDKTACTNDGDACGDFNVSSAIVLTGAGQASTIIDGPLEFQDRVFRVEPAGNLMMSGVTIEKGRTPGSSNCTGNSNHPGAGGGIEVLGQLSLQASTVINNHAGFLGGGIAEAGNAASTTTLDNVTVKGNTAQQGGGAAQCGGPGTLTINNSVVTENVADGYAAGVDEDSGGIVNITNSKISKNTATGARRFAADVGGVAEDGGGTVTITGSTIDGNTSDSQAGGVVEDGGGVLKISQSVVSNNTARDSAAGIYLDGSGTITLDHLEVFGNTALGTASTGRSAFLGGGGGITDDGGDAITMSDVYVHDNTASHGAGMLFDGAGTTNMTNVTVSNNKTALLGNEGGAQDGFGGGILVDGAQLLTVVNSTVSGNTSASQGGGIMWQNGISTKPSSLSFVTIADNTAAVGGQNLQLLDKAVVNLRATIVSGSAANCGGGTAPVSQGFNLDSGSSCQLGQTGDQSNANPRLAALANNGGFEPTRALNAGSPAIDAVSTGCPPPSTDQRGVTRPQGTRCDVGAFEAVPAPPTSAAGPATVPGLPLAGGRWSDPAASIGAWLGLGALLATVAVAGGTRSSRRRRRGPRRT